MPTRAKAQALIMAGLVSVKGKKAMKSGALILLDDPITIEKGPPYISRGGIKLEGALDDFQLSPKRRICMDVGASTGGFTDCLLQRGAEKVFSIDVGRGQLDDSIKNHPKVQVMEETHILSVQKNDLNPIPEFVVMDLSFISLKKVLPHIKRLVGPNRVLVPLVKPQFEVGPEKFKEGSGSIRRGAKGSGYGYHFLFRRIEDVMPWANTVPVKRTQRKPRIFFVS